MTAAIDYQYDVAVGVGDDTRHAAGDCDYRESGGVRLMATLYIADVTENNVENIVQHYTDPFPPADEEFLLKWKGLHWNKERFCGASTRLAFSYTDGYEYPARTNRVWRA